MNEPVLVGDVMNRSFVAVNEGDTVSGAARLMTDETVTTMVVLRGQEPVGILRASDIVTVVANSDNPEEATVREIMSETIESVSPDHFLTEAISSIAKRDIQSLIVMEDGDVIGMLSEHDVVTANLMLPADTGARNPDEQMLVEGDELSASGEPDDFSNQSVCEICGSLSRTLSNVNGQLVCADCLAV